MQHLWMISRVCEEFNCLPSQAVDELESDPENLALVIPELRAYARVKAAVESPNPKALDGWPSNNSLVQLAKQNAFEARKTKAKARPSGKTRPSVTTRVAPKSNKTRQRRA